MKIKKMWLVPIRYWENSEPIQFDLIIDGTCPMTGLPYGENYGFHHGYKHNVYAPPEDIFPTRKAVKAEIARRCAVRDEQFTKWVRNFFGKGSCD